MIVISLLFITSCFCVFLLNKVFPRFRQFIPFGMTCGVCLLVFKTIFGIGQLKYSGLLFDILLCFSFGSMALESKRVNLRAIFEFNDFWFYSILQFITQWSLAIICGVVMSQFIDIPSYLTSLLPVGFAGGYGSAATAGNLYLKGYSISDAIDIFMFSSTVGLILSIVGAIILVGRTDYRFHQDTKHLPQLKQLSFKGFITLSLVTAMGLGLSLLLMETVGIYIPGFALAFIWGNILRKFLSPMIKKEDLIFSSYYSSELLVIFGIGLINLSVINKLLIPISFLLFIGLALALFMYYFLAKRILKKNIFERSIFTWGWSVGGIITALATIQSLDSKEARTTLKEYMQIYLFISPFEIIILFLSPYFIMSGQWYILLGILLIFAIISWQFVYKKALNPLK